LALKDTGIQWYSIGHSNKDNIYIFFLIIKEYDIYDIYDISFIHIKMVIIQ